MTFPIHWEMVGFPMANYMEALGEACCGARGPGPPRCTVHTCKEAFARHCMCRMVSNDHRTQLSRACTPPTATNPHPGCCVAWAQKRHKQWCDTFGVRDTTCFREPTQTPPSIPGPEHSQMPGKISKGLNSPSLCKGSSLGFGCISVKGSSTATSLQRTQRPG